MYRCTLFGTDTTNEVDRKPDDKAGDRLADLARGWESRHDDGYTAMTDGERRGAYRRALLLCVGAIVVGLVMVGILKWIE